MLGYLIVWLISLSCVSFATCNHLLERCKNDTDCVVPHSECRYVTCEMKTCLCQDGYTPDYRHTVCLKRSLLGEPCKTTTDCIPEYSVCNSANVCECVSQRNASADKLRCQHHIEKILGGPCEGNDYCGASADCRNNTCTCDVGYSPWTSPDMWTWIEMSTHVPCQINNRKTDRCDAKPVG